MQKTQRIGWLLVVGLIAAVAVGQWRIHARRQTTPVVVLQRPRAVMGTACSMAAVVMARDRAQAEDALRAAEGELRSIETRMSGWLGDSEISRLNAAEPGRQVALAADTLVVLRAARAAAAETHGAFDVTCGPLVKLWQKAGQSGVLPNDAKVEQARAASNWSLFELDDAGAKRLDANARLDLGGITKGYAIDRAVEVLQQAEIVGGMVDVGGDLRSFGRQPTSGLWPVEVQNPFGAGHLVELKIPGGAVATSGNYARFAEIDGVRYSHIIDPRTGRPTQAAASATVIAQEAMTADVWATALSVLGPDGFSLLPEGVDALVVTGDERDFHLHATSGFRELMVEPVPQEITVWKSPRHAE